MRFAKRRCIARCRAAVELIGEKWAFLILRGALNGLQHFEEFQAGLGIARNILSDRLGKLVAGGILERTPDPTDRRKVIYSLTAKGEALLPVVLALRQWGEDWGHGPATSSSPTGATAAGAPDLRAGRRTAASLSLSDLMWIDRAKTPQSATSAARKGGPMPPAGLSLRAYS